MLDVHAPHAAARGWRDFLIHIATIVIGLLIAIGLEQSVEWAHHKQQVREAREAIQLVRAVNKHLFAHTTARFRIETRQFQTNLAVLGYLQQHPGAPAASWPGAINWHSYIPSFSNAAWQTAQHSGVAALMPQQEVRDAEHLYYHLGVVQASGAERLRTIGMARRYTALDSDPSHLTPQQLADAIVLAETMLIAHYRMGGDMRNLNISNPDFAPAPLTDELRAIVHEGPMTDAERRAFWLDEVPSGAK